MDALTDILNSLKLNSSLYFRTELSAPWGVEVPRQGNVARFHIAIRGDCWLKVEGKEEGVHLANGDLAIVPHGASHFLTDKPSSQTKALDEVLNEVSYTGTGPLVYGGGGAGCCLVCGEFSFDSIGQHPLLQHLPSILFVPGDSSYNTQWLDSAIGFIAHEAASDQPGAHAIVDRLSEIILVQVIRATLSAAKEQNTTLPFLSAFMDKKINKVLSAIHAKPENNWTVQELGELANMSRSSFANRFGELTNMSPLKYVLFVRLQKASSLLIETNLTVLSIAGVVGYHSEASFSQAFKRHYGIRPGEFRKKYATQSEAA